MLGGIISNKNIDNYKADLKKIDKVLDKGDKIVFFTCHTGQIDQNGDNSFIGKIAKYTGVDVYANQSWSVPSWIFKRTEAIYPSHYTYSDRKYAFDNAGDWTVAKPDASSKSGYKIKEIGAVSFRSNGEITSHENWKTQNVSSYYKKVGWTNDGTLKMLK